MANAIVHWRTPSGQHRTSASADKTIVLSLKAQCDVNSAGEGGIDYVEFYVSVNGGAATTHTVSARTVVAANYECTAYNGRHKSSAFHYSLDLTGLAGGKVEVTASAFSVLGTETAAPGSIIIRNDTDGVDRRPSTKVIYCSSVSGTSGGAGTIGDPTDTLYRAIRLACNTPGGSTSTELDCGGAVIYLVDATTGFGGQYGATSFHTTDGWTLKIKCIGTDKTVQRTTPRVFTDPQDYVTGGGFGGASDVNIDWHDAEFVGAGPTFYDSGSTNYLIQEFGCFSHSRAWVDDPAMPHADYAADSGQPTAFAHSSSGSTRRYSWSGQFRGGNFGAVGYAGLFDFEISHVLGVSVQSVTADCDDFCYSNGLISNIRYRPGEVDGYTDTSFQFVVTAGANVDITDPGDGTMRIDATNSTPSDFGTQLSGLVGGAGYWGALISGATSSANNGCFEVLAAGTNGSGFPYCILDNASVVEETGGATLRILTAKLSDSDPYYTIHPDILQMYGDHTNFTWSEIRAEDCRDTRSIVGAGRVLVDGVIEDSTDGSHSSSHACEFDWASTNCTNVHLHGLSINGAASFSGTFSNVNIVDCVFTQGTNIPTSGTYITHCHFVDSSTKGTSYSGGAWFDAEPGDTPFTFAPSSGNLNTASGLLGRPDTWWHSGATAESRGVSRNIADDYWTLPMTTQLYTVPDPSYESSRYTATVNGDAAGVFGHARLPHFLTMAFTSLTTEYEMSIFTFGDDNPAGAEVAISGIGALTITSAEVYPKSLGIVPVVSAGVATFTIPYHTKVLIEFNGDKGNPLIVCNDPPTDALAPGYIEYDAGITTKAAAGEVLYFPPGLHVIGSNFVCLPLSTVHIAGGAVVVGTFDLDDNANIEGHGVISGLFATPESFDHSGAYFNANYNAYTLLQGYDGTGTVTKGGSISGVTLLASPFYNINGGASYVSDVKIISPWYENTDGIAIYGDPANTTAYGRVSEISNCFIYVGDDAIQKVFTAGDGTFDGNFIVSATGCSILLGYTSCSTGVGQTTVTNTTVVTRGTIATPTWGSRPVPIASHGRSVIKLWRDETEANTKYSRNNINIDGLTVEGEGTHPLLTIENSLYYWGTSNDAAGDTTGITISNVTMETTPTVRSRIYGRDFQNTPHGIAFDNIEIGGTTVDITNWDDYFDLNSYVFDVSFDGDTIASVVADGDMASAAWSPMVGVVSVQTAPIGGGGGSGGSSSFSGGFPIYIYLGDTMAVGTATSEWTMALGSVRISGPTPGSLVRPSNQKIWSEVANALHVYTPHTNSNTSGSVTTTAAHDLSIMAALGELHPDGFALVKRGSIASSLATEFVAYSAGGGGRWAKSASQHYQEMQQIFADCVNWINQTMGRQADMRGAFVTLGTSDMQADGGAAFASALPQFCEDLWADFSTRTGGEKFPISWRVPQNGTAADDAVQMALIRTALSDLVEAEPQFQAVDVDDLERDRTDDLQETPESAVVCGDRMVTALRTKAI